MATVLLHSTLDLPTINTVIVQQEIIRIGPLTDIGNDGTNTTIGINTDAGLPASHTVIVTSGTIPPGTTQVATGQIFVSGTITDATAYR